MGSRHQKKEGFPGLPGKGNLRQFIMFYLLVTDTCIEVSVQRGRGMNGSISTVKDDRAVVRISNQKG